MSSSYIACARDGMFVNCCLLLIVVTVWSIDPRLEKFRTAQRVEDREGTMYAPNLFSMTEMTPQGNYTLKTLIHVGLFSSVFTVVETKNVLIKYQCDCDDPGSLHPLLRDAWFTQMANDYGVPTAQIFYVSSPTKFPRTGSTRKIPFRMNRREWNYCANAKGRIRYMIIERLTGETVLQLKDRVYGGEMMNFTQALRILDTVFDLLQTLHSNGIVHGDIHGRNVMLATDKIVGSTRVYLIDYERAFFDDSSRSNERVNRVGSWTHELTSPWQIMGLPWGMRDDVYRSLDMFARLINSPGWAAHVKTLTDSGYENLHQWRTQTFLFDSPYGRDDPFNPSALHVSPEVAASVKEKMISLLGIVLELDDVNTIPPFDTMRKLINETTQLILVGGPVRTGTLVVKNEEDGD